MYFIFQIFKYFNYHADFYQFNVHVRTKCRYIMHILWIYIFINNLHHEHHQITCFAHEKKS